MATKDSSKPNKTTTTCGSTIWFTGFSASGKSTLASRLHRALSDNGIQSVILDGDEVRKTINNDLGYSIPDREENNRRVAEMAKIINNSGVITLCAFISPTNKIRENIKQIIGSDNFILVHVDTPIEICESRDSKSLYKKAKEGKVKDFSGISSLFENPENPDIRIDGKKSVDKNIDILLTRLKEIIPYSF